MIKINNKYEEIRGYYDREKIVVNFSFIIGQFVHPEGGDGMG